MAISQINSSSLASGVPSWSNLPTGSVLQVVTGTYATTVTTTSSSFSDTGLTATITPKFSTSKILILISQPYQGYVTSGNARDEGMAFGIAKDGTLIWQQTGSIGIYLDLGTSSTFAINQYGQLNLSYIDTISTTTAKTYKLQFQTQSGRTALVNTTGSNAPASIILMEIAG